MNPPGEITRLLSAWTEGDEHALQQLMPLVYDELHRIARHHWSSQPEGHTLQPTALIHEAFLKLVSPGEKAFRIAPNSMPWPPWPCARYWSTMRRPAWPSGGGQLEVSLQELDPAVESEAKGVLELNAALNTLQAIDPRKSRVVELRYFGGLSIEETAEALSVSPVTVTRDWQTARAWLARELGMGNAIRP